MTDKWFKLAVAVARQPLTRILSVNSLAEGVPSCHSPAATSGTQRLQKAASTVHIRLRTSTYVLEVQHRIRFRIRRFCASPPDVAWI